MTESESAPQSYNIFGRPLSIFGVPVDRKIIFADHKGNYKSRIEKRQRKLIVKSTFIKFFLHHNEQIQCLTTGYSPVSVLEQVLTGPAFLFFKRAIFIFTDERILHIPTRFNRSSFNSAVSQILYEDCAGIVLKGRNLIVKYKNGTEERFPYIGRREKKKLRALLAGVELKPKAAGKLKQRALLCPSCTNVLNRSANTCPACKLKFKSGLGAKIRAWLIPGGGYFYTRHMLMGTVACILEIAIMAKIIYDWIAFRDGLSVNLLLTAVLLCVLMGEKAISAFHCSQLVQDFLPVPKEFATRKI